MSESSASSLHMLLGWSDTLLVCVCAYLYVVKLGPEWRKCPAS